MHPQTRVEHPHDVLLRQLPRLRVALGDDHRHVDGELVAAGPVAVSLARLAVLAVDLGDPLDGREDHQVREATLRGPLDRLARALRRAPHRWMRLLERPRPRVHVVEAVEPAVEWERALFGPGAQDQLGGLVEALARVRRVDSGREVLRADAAHESRDDAAARDDVEHGNLLGDAQRVLAERQPVAEDRDLRSGSPAHEHRRHHVGARHRAVAVLVMLVDAEPVPAELLRVLELVEVLVVERVADRGVVVAVRQRHPRRRLVVVHDVRHQVEVVELHRLAP